MREQTLNRELKRFVKWRLSHYPADARQLREHKARLEELKRAGFVQPGEERYYMELERTVGAVEAALEQLPREDRALIDLVFWKKSHSVDGAARELNYSKSAAYRHIDAALSLLAGELGYAPER